MNPDDLLKEAKRFFRDPERRKQVLLGLWRAFGANFVKAWLFRAGASLLSLLIRLLKTRDPAFLRDIWRVFLARTSINFGLFVASYFVLFKGLEEKWIPMGRDKFGIKDGTWDSGIAGAVSAITMLLFEQEESIRKILGHYSAVRAFQIIYNQSSLYKFWGNWPYVLLFMLSSGQVSCSFSNRPEVLDPDYRGFLAKVTGFHPIIVQTLRNKFRGRHIDFDEVAKVILKYRDESMSLAMKRSPEMLSCYWIHPESACIHSVFRIWTHVFKIMFPVYGSLHAIPPLLFRPGKIQANPLGYLKSVLLATIRSSTFMATFMFLFRAGLCVYRNAIGVGIFKKRDSPFMYGMFGFLGAIAIMIEKDHRRVELSLYVCHFNQIFGKIIIFRWCQKLYMHLSELWRLNLTSGWQFRMEILSSFLRQCPSSW